MTDSKPILFFADRLPPLIGGMEVHARYFIEHFSGHDAFPLMGIITKSAEGDDMFIAQSDKKNINLTDLSKTISPAIIFFNSGRWIEELTKIRALFPTAILLYRTGGNEILKAPLVHLNIQNHQLRQAYWVATINHTIDLMITNSEYTENRLREIGLQCLFSRCVGGVNIKALKKNLGTPGNNSITFFCAARFVPYKNHCLLISVFTELISRRHNIQLQLAGEGPLLNSIKNLVMKNNLGSRVEFLGTLDNQMVCEKISNADIYIQFSKDYLTNVLDGEYIHAEGMGRSILEALSAGVFVIAGKCGALAEIVSENRGLLIDLDEVQTIADKIEDVLKKIPINLPPINQYSWENLFSNYETILKKLAC